MSALIINHLWQSSLFVLGVALLTFLFRNNGAHVRYWLWWVASLKFLVPFSLVGMLGATVAASAPETLRSMTVYPALKNLATPVVAAEGLSLWVWALAALWALGALAVIVHWGRHALHLHHIRRQARPAPERVSASVPGLPVLYTASPLEPGLVGLLRPALLLPEGIDERLTPEQMQAVFGHELAHWRRRDNLTGAAHMLVAALFWFHPFLWWIGNRLVHERERACDEAVMASGHNADTYAEGILNVCHFYVASKLACAPGVSGADLKARITTIMTERTMVKLHALKKVILALAATAIIALPVAAGAVGSQDTPGDARSHVMMPLKRVPAQYPKDALEKKLQGVVVMEFTVDKKGKPKDIHVTHSTITPAPGTGDLPDPERSISADAFDKASIEAVRQFEFPLTMENGQAVERKGVQFQFTFAVGDGRSAAGMPEPLRQAWEQVEQAGKQLAAAQKAYIALAENQSQAKLTEVQAQIVQMQAKMVQARERFDTVQQAFFEQQKQMKPKASEPETTQ